MHCIYGCAQAYNTTHNLELRDSTYVYVLHILYPHPSNAQPCQWGQKNAHNMHGNLNSNEMGGEGGGMRGIYPCEHWPEHRERHLRDMYICMRYVSISLRTSGIEKESYR